MSETEPMSLVMADVARLEDLVDREALGQICRSFFELFGIAIRVFSSSGAMLADVHEEREVCRYVNGLAGGRLACSRTVGEVRALVPSSTGEIHACFTGAVYRVGQIEYDRRAIGRFVLGPYLPSEVEEVPKSLLVIDPGVDPERARQALAEMPRVRRETTEKICRHLTGVLDLILFSGHRAYLTSEMHLASVRESYRELAEKAQNLQHAYDRLQELDRLKSNFLATVSHELRTPLTSVIGYSEMLGSGIAGPLNEEQTQFVDTIRGKSDQLLALITSLLDLSKLEQGKLSLALEPVDTAGLLGEIASTLAPTAQKRDVRVVVDCPPGTPKLRADPVRIRQVVLNLADNAMKFSPAGGEVRLRARVVEVAPSDGEGGIGMVLLSLPRRALEIAVSDTGIGIAPEEQQKIFDPFYQVDGSSTRQHGGAGLGLSIVKRLVDAHEGTVRVESAPDRGTTFFVTLPEIEDGDLG